MKQAKVSQLSACTSGVKSIVSEELAPEEKAVKVRMAVFISAKDDCRAEQDSVGAENEYCRARKGQTSKK
jgi:hypothetical protein